MTNLSKSVVVVFLIAALCGCQATGQQYASNVYQAGQVNSRQEAKTVNILAVLPAKVAVDNTKAKQTAQVFGALLGAVAGGAVGANVGKKSATNTTVGAAGGAVAGAAAGSLVDDKVLVDGVSIAYEDSGHTYTSAQVGAACEFAAGRALMIATSPTETRIQPNAACPPKDHT